MSTEHARIGDGALTFRDPGQEKVKDQIEGHLRYHYSRRLFVQDVEKDGDNYFIKVGVVYPRDVSNCRERDDVLKMVNIGDVKTLYAKRLENDYYRIALPDRSDLYASFKERHQDILTRLDWTMAKAIYSHIYKLPPVRNQLNSLIEIVDFLRHEGSFTVERIDDALTTPNTEKYLDVLEDLEYIRLKDGVVTSGYKMESADMQNREEKEVIGSIIDDGYYVLRQKLGLHMLKHFPMFANSYYLSAFRKNDRDLWLSFDDVVENLRAEYRDNTDPWKVRRKLEALHEVEVIRFENREVGGRDTIFDAANPNIAAIG